MSTKTFNRRPYQVGSPSSGDVKDYYFNHFNWKGMSTDKNFLAADQETFEECNNVYMDEEGILRSRPAFAHTWKFPNCDKFWVFGDVFVYLTGTTLTFVNRGTASSKDVGDSDILLLMKSNKIFCFTKTRIYSYDVNTRRYEKADENVYVPTVSVSSVSVTTKNEAKNLLSNRTTENYLYDSELGLPTGLKEGDSVSVKIDDVDYYIQLNKRNFPLLVSEAKCIYQGDLVAFASTNYNGQDVLATLYSSGDLYFSYDYGKTRKYVDTIPVTDEQLYDGFVHANFSKDSSLFYVNVDYSGVWVIDALVDASHSKYPSFTKFRSYRGGDYGVAGNRTMFFTNTDYVELLVAEDPNDQYRTYLYLDTYFNGVLTSKKVADWAYVGVNAMDIDYYGGKLKTVVQVGYRLVNNLASDEISWKQMSDSVSIISIKNNIVISYKVDKCEILNLVDLSPIVSIAGAGLPEFLSSDGNYVLSYAGVWSIDRQTFVKFLGEKSYTPFGYGKYYYVAEYDAVSDQDVIRSNNISEPITVVKKNGELINTDFLSKLHTSRVSELNNFYVAIGRSLFVSEDRYDEDGNFLWYFPEYTKQEFAKNISGLFPISSTEMAIFFEDEIWYSSFNDGVYTYYKSKLPVGLKTGSDIVASYDGSNVLFATERGMASLSYQDFVASSEQTLTFLSDPIHRLFKEFVASPVKICRYQYWYLCYSTDNKKGYLFDVRNNSWWPLESPETVDKFFVFDNEVVLFKNGNFLALNKTDNDYKDKIGGSEYDINWNFKSQKLHFGAINYNKHIANITLYAVLDSNDIVRFKMEVNNYRKKMDTAEIQSIEYRVDAIRTFVKRVSYFKVNEFQYNIHQDDEEAIKLPLSLSGITVKYRISGEVR